MTKNANHDELYETLLKLKNIDDFRKFFDDLCTRKELDSMTQRIKSAKLLLNGETFERIIEKTDISSATLSKVNRCVKYGEGYKNFL